MAIWTDGTSDIKGFLTADTGTGRYTDGFADDRIKAWKDGMNYAVDYSHYKWTGKNWRNRSIVQLVLGIK